MLTYSMKTTEKGNFLIEKDTKLEIPINKDPKTAKAVMRNVNMGGGFDGHTPTFFTWKGLETN
jgi:hypothetical protein